MKLEVNTDWSANIKEIDMSIFEENDLQVRPQVAEKISQILSHKDQRKNFNFGMSLIEKDLTDINVYISAIMKVRTMRRKAKFYVSTDSEDILNKLIEATGFIRSAYKESSRESPIIPNFVGDEFSERERFIIDFFCLKSMYNIFATPF